MQHLSIRAIIAVTSLIIGIVGVVIWMIPFSEVVQNQTSVISLCSFESKEHLISDSEAIELAECFVAEQGYTGYFPMVDKSKLKYEFMDVADSEELINQRHNTLENKAYGVRYQKAVNHWKVVFPYNLKNESIKQFDAEFLEQLKTAGRVVTMDDYGRSIRTEHEDLELSTFRKIEK